MWTKEFKNRAVVSLSDAKKIGTVSDVIFRPDSGDVAGFILSTGGLIPGLFDERRYLPIDAVRSIGQDAVTIPDQSVLARTDNAGELKTMPSVGRLIGLSVVTEGGRLIGKVSDVYLDPETRHLMNLRVSSIAGGPLQGFSRGSQEDLVVRFSGDIRIGPDLVVVPDSAISGARAPQREEPYDEEGWRRSA